jgi:sugar lactone lactonase YvrE
MLYIKVHKYDADKNPVFISPECISSFARNDAHNATVICEQHGTSWWVSETPDEIFAMLKDVARNQFDNLVVVDKKGSTVHLISEVE